MKTLKDLTPEPQFNTSSDEVDLQFLIPALQRSTRYDRGVGYFSSAWLRRVASGLVGLAENSGTARIVASPKLSAQDWAALKQGVDAQHDVTLRDSLWRTIDQLATDLTDQTLSALAWMVADSLLEFRIALPANNLDGDFHDKFGQFHDTQGNTVAFHGSPNDSERAFCNYEAISCFYSWVDEREKRRVASEIERFERLWANRDANVRVFPLPEAIRRHLVQFTEHSARPYKAPAPQARLVDRRWRHQAEALGIFVERMHGILAMATGTGKTRTALAILNELKNRSAVKTAVVTMSGTDLLDQWRRELTSESPFPIYRAYEGSKEQQEFLNAPSGSLLLISRQALSPVLTRLPDTIKRDALIICDEVHGLGSEGLARSLRGLVRPFKYRLGLSATPEREYDQEGNDFIENEIGPVIFEFGLEDAIERGILCELDYEPLSYTLSTEDRKAIRDAIRAYHGRIRAGEPASQEDLARQISAVRKKTLTKLPPFDAYVRQHPQTLNRCLIFVEDREYGLRVQDCLLAITGRYHTYYADDSRDNLIKFSKGDIDCLVTCHRISEGIDIRSVNNIVLFSSSRAKLETVQRLGRCLRVDRDNPSKRALVVDFVEHVDDDNTSDPDDLSSDEERREWLRKLSRVTRKE